MTRWARKTWRSRGAGSYGAACIVLLAIVFVAGAAFGFAPPKVTDGSGRGPTRAGGGEPARARGEIPSTAAVMHGPTMLGTAVYPVQELPIRFKHDQHLALGLDCGTCHTEIDASRRASDNNFPKGAQCDSCHGKQHPKPTDEPANCSLCHTKVDSNDRVTAALRAPKAMLHFNHVMHAKAGSDCEDCHGDMTKVRLATTLQLPSEADCLSCHDGFTAAETCGTCHPSEATGRLRIRAMDDRTLPALVPRGASSWGAEHDLAFVEDHASISKSNPNLCASCHDDDFCTDCHAGSIRPMRIHAADFMTTHALEANAQTQNCQSCHRTQTFCLGCHQRLELDRESGAEFGVGGTLSFHPSDWAGPPGMAQGHAHAAQRNMAACASCHTEDSCLACHATSAGPAGGLGVSPHGAGFRESARCSALSTRNRRVCLKCHAPGVPELECI